MKPLRFAVILALLSAAPLLAEQTLPEVLALALQNSPAVHMAQADLKKAQAQLAQAHDAYIPNFSIASSAGDYFGFSPNQSPIVTATSQSLVFSFPHREEQAAARKAVDAAQLQLKDAREQVIMETATSYARIQSMTAELEALASAVAYGDELVQIVQQRVDAGLSARNELTQSRLTAANMRLQHAHLENEQAAEIEHLANITHIPVVEIRLVAAPFPAVPTPQAHNAPPAVAASQAGAAAKHHLQLADEKQIYRPQFYFGQQYSRYSTYNNFGSYYKNFQSNGYGFGIDINIPLFDAVKRAKGLESAADAMHARAEADLALIQSNEHRAQIERSLRELEAAADVATLKQQLAQDQLNATIALEQNGNGQPASAQTSPAQEKQVRMEERQRAYDSLEAGFNLIKAKLALLRASGELEAWAASL